MTTTAAPATPAAHALAGLTCECETPQLLVNRATGGQTCLNCLGSPAAPAVAVYTLAYTPGYSEYDAPEHKALLEQAVTTHGTVEELHRELDAHGVPRSAWRDGRYAFHGCLWTWAVAPTAEPAPHVADGPAYCRTHSATRRHIARDQGKTRCGQRIALMEHYTDDSGQPRTAAGWMVRDLPPCGNCETSKTRAGNAGNRRTEPIGETEMTEPETQPADDTESVCGVSYDHTLVLISEIEGPDGGKTFECRECKAEILEDADGNPIDPAAEAATYEPGPGMFLDIPAGHNGLTRGYRMWIVSAGINNGSGRLYVNGRQIPTRGGKPGRTRHVWFLPGQAAQYLVPADDDAKPAAPRKAKPRKLPQTQRYALYRALQNTDQVEDSHSWTPRGAYLPAIRKLQALGLVLHVDSPHPTATAAGREAFFAQDPAQYGHSLDGIRQPGETTGGDPADGPIPTVTADPGDEGIEIRADRLYMYTGEGNDHEIQIIDGMGDPDTPVWALLTSTLHDPDTQAIVFNVELPDGRHITIQPSTPGALYPLRTAR